MEFYDETLQVTWSQTDAGGSNNVVLGLDDMQSLRLPNFVTSSWQKILKQDVRKQISFIFFPSLYLNKRSEAEGRLELI